MKEPKKQIEVINKIRADINQGKYADGVRMPTEAEYSALLNVSRQTVRKALNALEAEAVITRIQGSGSYVNKQSFRRQKTGQIAVICTYISEYIFPSILRGIETVTKDNDYQLLISSTNNSIASERMILSKLLDNPVDGIIAEGTKTALPNPNRGIYHALATQGIPIVFINSVYPDIAEDNIIHIVTDDYSGGYIATEKMISEGHSNICGIFRRDDTKGIGRYSGYMDAIVHMGAPVHDNNVIWFSTETKDLLLRNIGDYIMGIDKSSTGVICYDDQIAATLVQYFENSTEYNISSMASFDKCIPISSKKIRFTSYPHPKEEMGMAAAVKLFRMISGYHEDSLVFPGT